MVKRLFVLLALLAVASAALVPLWRAYRAPTALNATAAHYATDGPNDVGAANLVTAVVVTYRGLDTLGEVTILFLTAAIISFFLGSHDERGTAAGSVSALEEADRAATRDATDPRRAVRPSSELLRTASDLLSPFIFLLGTYVFVNGHLTPGGGFQGGAIMASGLVLMLLADPLRTTNRALFAFVESISGLGFVALALAGIAVAGGFLDNAVLPLGEFGALLSAGIIPIIYILIGLKVGAELATIVATYQSAQGGRP